MLMLSRGDGRVVKTIRKREVSTSAFWRPSAFVFCCETERGFLVKNTLSRQVFCLSEDEWSAFRCGDVTHPAARELAELRFLVEEGFRELELYFLVLQVMRSMEKKPGGCSSYTILPTTACNARCVYCYEEGWVSTTMSEATADQAVEYICRSKREGKIRLTWFGGEPLCGAGIISRICRALTERGVDFSSHMITNGTLLTPELTAEARDVWRLADVQVSMDGAREDYEARKRYLRPERFHYNRAMDAVRLLSDAGIGVTLRCNYDAENLPHMRNFFDDCSARFDGKEKIKIYMEQLFQSSRTEDSASLYRDAEAAMQYAESLGLTGRKRAPTAFRTRFCMADSCGRSVIIDPQGGLHCCENRIDDEPFGTVFDAEPASAPAPREELAEDCRSCPFLPECTPFRKSGCPVVTTACRTQMELRTRRELADLSAHEAPRPQEEEELPCP